VVCVNDQECLAQFLKLNRYKSDTNHLLLGKIRVKLGDTVCHSAGKLDLGIMNTKGMFNHIARKSRVQFRGFVTLS
jgi:uncharacterized pyridoxamine 5'-phosphate oxidase family protein